MGKFLSLLLNLDSIRKSFADQGWDATVTMSVSEVQISLQVDVCWPFDNYHVKTVWQYSEVSVQEMILDDKIFDAELFRIYERILLYIDARKLKG